MSFEYSVAPSFSPDDVFAIYLRKSRAEEGQDMEETLSRHLTSLYVLADRLHIVVDESDIYKEVVSGESLAARPQMRALLDVLDDGRYRGILCMDMDRLGRGDMGDQGIILSSFKYSDTLIITPDKIFDMNDTVDEDAAEFKTFQARWEYKTIVRRMRRGLMQTIRAGGYVSNPPFGYRPCKIGRLPSLEIVPEEAEYVRLMFRMYAEGNGCTTIEHTLNALGVRGRRDCKFNRNTVRTILKNPVYIGKVRWNASVHIKSGSGLDKKSRVVEMPPEKWLLFDGAHEAIIDLDTWKRVREIYRHRYMPPRNTGEIKSPLAGICYCSRCGRRMQMMECHKGVPYLLCNTKACVAGVKFAFAESAVLRQLHQMRDDLTLSLQSAPSSEASTTSAAIAAADAELSRIRRRRDRLYDFLEDGTYDRDTYNDRMRKSNEDERRVLQQKETLQGELSRNEQLNLRRQLDQLNTVLSLYASQTPAGKNMLLKSIISRINYTKEKKTKPADFLLSITLRDFYA